MSQTNKQITVDLITDWEKENGESFFDYAEYFEVPDLLQFIHDQYPDQLEKWQYAYDDCKYLCSTINEVSDEDEDEYESVLEIVCEFINSNPELLNKYNEFLEEYDTEE